MILLKKKKKNCNFAPEKEKIVHPERKIQGLRA